MKCIETGKKGKQNTTGRKEFHNHGMQKGHNYV